MSETKYISEIISEKEIVTWENQNILITAPTGAGKSYFIKNKLYDYALANNKKIFICFHDLTQFCSSGMRYKEIGKPM